MPFRSFTGTKCRYQDKRTKRAVFTPINGTLYLGAPSLHRVIQDLYFDCFGLFLFIFFMFFIVFPFDLCNIITLKFFYGFFNDPFHEFNLIKCHGDADLPGGRAAAAREHRRQGHQPDHRPWGIGGQCPPDTLQLGDNVAIL